MKKRTFLKRGGTMVLGSTLISFCSTPEQKKMPAETKDARLNWAGNLEYAAEEFYQPASIEALQELVRAADKIRALGTTHCFNTIADSRYNQASVRSFPLEIQLDNSVMKATIDAGASYGQICSELYNQGYALHNLASLPHISVAGAIATATHGSGVKNGNLGSAVFGIEFIDASGELQRLSRDEDPEIFEGIVTHLGAVGILTSITLDLLPAFEVSQHVYQYLPVKNLLENFTAIMCGGYSVSLFTDYQTDTVNQVWVKLKESSDMPSPPDDYYGARPADRDLHPIVEISAENCTRQMGVPGPWYDRLPHFRMEFTPSSGKELQSEFFVPLEKAPEAFELVSSLREQLEPVLMISEIRTIAADNQWMSPFYHQDSVAFHFTWEQDREGVESVLPLIQDGLEHLQVRPHWGKVFTVDTDRLKSLYPNLQRFKEVVARYDPGGKFRNEFLERYLY
jgi:xylitol oxidase